MGARGAGMGARGAGIGARGAGMGAGVRRSRASAYACSMNSAISWVYILVTIFV